MPAGAITSLEAFGRIGAAAGLPSGSGPFEITLDNRSSDWTDISEFVAILVNAYETPDSYKDSVTIRALASDPNVPGIGVGFTEATGFSAPPVGSNPIDVFEAAADTVYPNSPLFVFDLAINQEDHITPPGVYTITITLTAMEPTHDNHSSFGVGPFPPTITASPVSLSVVLTVIGDDAPSVLPVLTMAKCCGNQAFLEWDAFDGYDSIEIFKDGNSYAVIDNNTVFWIDSINDNRYTHTYKIRGTEGEEADTDFSNELTMLPCEVCCRECNAAVPETTKLTLPALAVTKRVIGPPHTSLSYVLE